MRPGLGIALGVRIGPRPRTDGGSVVAPPTGLATPTFALASSPGATPVSFNVFSTDYTASFYGQLEIATDAAFTNITQNIVHDPDGAEWATLDASYGFVDPSGTYCARFRFLEDCPSGTAGAITVTDQLGNTFTALASAWSNTVTDTISSSSAVLTSITGTGKSQYLTINSPFLSATFNNSVNSLRNARATVSASGKKHFEVSIDAGGAGSTWVGIGVSDTTSDFNTNVSLGVSSPGSTFLVSPGTTNTTVRRNGTQTAGTSLDANPAIGDKLICEFDSAANTVSYYYYRAATTTTKLIATFTLTSFIPAAYYAFAGASQLNDAFTANFGGSSFTMTPTAGYSFYG